MSPPSISLPSARASSLPSAGTASSIRHSRHKPAAATVANDSPQAEKPTTFGGKGDLLNKLV